MANTSYIGDAKKVLQTLPDKSVNCITTSPPYWKLRDYGTGKWTGGNTECTHVPHKIKTKKQGNPAFNENRPSRDKTLLAGEYQKVCSLCGAAWLDEQIGLEQTPRQFIESLLAVFKECYRVLNDDGTMWVNIGDSYNGSGKAGSNPEYMAKHTSFNRLADAHTFGEPAFCQQYKPKDLIGVPWMLAFALRDECGFYLRQDIIWSKPNPMPESVTDRCTKAHEYIFLFSKKRKYFYDAYAIATEPLDPVNGLSGALGQPKHIITQPRPNRAHGIVRDRLLDYDSKEKVLRPNVDRGQFEHEKDLPLNNGKANKKSVWTISSTPYKGIHYAVFPSELAEYMIKAGTSEHGCCAACGKQHIRILEKKLVPTKKACKVFNVDERDMIADANDQGSNRAKDGHKKGWINEMVTTSWQKPCKCPTDEIKPAVVLDPFGGSGTTAIVANKLHRNSILIDLNEKYVREDQQKRLHAEIGLFNDNTIININD